MMMPVKHVHVYDIDAASPVLRITVRRERRYNYRSAWPSSKLGAHALAPNIAFFH